MRRMITTKQSDYIDNLQKVAEIDNSALKVKNLQIEENGSININDVDSIKSDDGVFQIEVGEQAIIRYNNEGMDNSLSFENGDSGVSPLIITFEDLILLAIPTSDPQIANALWNDNGVLKISAGE